MLINFTNHPSKNWSKEQISAGMKYGNIHDLPFPTVDPGQDENYICELAQVYTDEIITLKPRAVLCQGEFSLAFAVVKKLKEQGIIVLSATSQRVAVEEKNKDGTVNKTAYFKFVNFRKYGG
ncbi:hypothetical protein LNN31_12665 [Acetobacterium wieringae]|uniref:CRISPR-associated protein n=1 Tax=Acetobacterium wieringae TaxID=52694 RepID=A0ABY6HAX7_9FIRM|nr:hypothetical protein [Acetobacterium wieringae]UYO61632.1 hypothetical protein LNN31_12665 [Acetobacterium wieringae]